MGFFLCLAEKTPCAAQGNPGNITAGTHPVALYRNSYAVMRERLWQVKAVYNAGISAQIDTPQTFFGHDKLI